MDKTVEEQIKEVENYFQESLDFMREDGNISTSEYSDFQDMFEKIGKLNYIRGQNDMENGQPQITDKD